MPYRLLSEHSATKGGLSGPLEQAIAIAQRCFGDVESWEIEMEYDPETGDEWVVVRFATRLSEEEVAEARKRYSAEWVGPCRGRNDVAYGLSCRTQWRIKAPFFCAAICS